MRISITVPGEPVAKARPRFTKNGHVYTPKKTAVYEQVIGLHARAAMKGHKILTGPIRLSVTAFFSIPKSWTLSQKAKAMSGALRHTKKPDLSNIIKSVEDALNGIVYADDAQIDRYGESRKAFSSIPRTEITVEAEDEA